MKAPKKIYLHPTVKGEVGATWLTFELTNEDVKYVRADAFIEKALKWYCLDCACNDNCKYKCAFWSFFKDYLEGNNKALPPKSENAINPDGSTTDNYRYRQFIKRVQDTFIEKACEWIEKNMDDYIHVEYDTVTGRPTNEAHIAHKKVVEDFKKYMEGE